MSDDLASLLVGGSEAPAPAQGAPQARKPGAFNSAMTDPQGALQGIIGSPVRINSTWRTPKHNAEVGGVADSFHLTGHAVDFNPPAGMTNAQAVQMIRRSGMPVTELLDEGSHVHVAWNGAPVGAAGRGNSVPQNTSDDLAGLLTAGAPASEPSPAATARPAPPLPTGDASDAAFSSAFAGTGKTLTSSIPPANRIARWNDKGQLVRPDTGQPFPAAVTKTYRSLMMGGVLDPEAPVGSAKNPLVQDDPSNTPAPGQFYIDALSGKFLKMPDGSAIPTSRALGSGVGQGVGDVISTIGHLLPGGEGSELGARMDSNRLLYEAQYGDNGAASLGRIGGQMLGSAPLMATGGLALGKLGFGLADAAPVLKPTVQFLAGKGGGNLLMRAASQGAKGVQEGAGFSASTSDASDRPLLEQIEQGGMAGGLVSAALPFGGAFARTLGNAGKLKGATSLPEQLVTYDAAQGLPVPVHLTLGQLTGAPGQQMEENALLRGLKGDPAAQVMKAAAAGQQDALRGNVLAIGSQIGGRELERGEGGAAVSDRLNAVYDQKKAEIDAAYTAARQKADGAYLPAAERPVVAQRLRDAVKDYDPEIIAPVNRVLDGLDGSPTSGTLTPRDLFEARTRLGNLRGNDPVVNGATNKAVKALDGYIDDALNADLIKGDPDIVNAWRDAIGKRRAFGKLFEGDDLINSLTQRDLHGDGVALKVSPEDATNYIFGRSNLGFVGKRDLTRDLTRLQGVLGADSPEWGALRAEAFTRIARAGEGAPEGGVAKFSGQHFMKAWNKANAEDPEVMRVLFSPQERDLINQFATVAQKATTPVRGGDNPSNSAIAMAKVVQMVAPLLASSGGAGAGGIVGGPVGAAGGAALGYFLEQLSERFSANTARKMALGAKPTVAKIAGPPNKLMLPIIASGSAAANRLIDQSSASQPQ